MRIRRRVVVLVIVVLAMLVSELPDVVAPLALAPASAAGEAGFHPVTPARIFDTRDGTGTTLGKIGPAGSRDIDVTGVGGVPATGVSSVVLNVTAVGPSATSHLTLWPAGIPKPVASNLNFVAGDVVPNLVTVKVGGTGSVSVYNNSGQVDVIADVVGWYDGDGSGDRFVGVTPERILDTRDGTGGPATKFGPLTTRELDVTGVGGVPSTGATAVVVNVTAVLPSASSHLTVWPSGVAKPDASNLNYRAGQVRPNLVVVKIGANGNVSLYNNSGQVDLIADVVGWFAPAGTPGLAGGGFEGVTPARILDTRDGTGGPPSKFGPGATRTLDVTGVGGVPDANVGAVILNVTAVNGSATSHLTVWPADVDKPDASNLNFDASQVVPNLVAVKVSPTGTVKLFNNSGNVDVLADVVGWYSLADPVDPNLPVDPATIAPPMPPGIPADPFNAVSFLYTGANAIQKGVAPGTIQPARAGVLKGTVRRRGGAALPGATVSIHGHPEYGTTISRADGRWDLVVNQPAAALTVQFAKTGLVPVQRRAWVGAGTFEDLDDVVLVALDTKVTTIAKNSSTMQVAQANPATDVDGTRTNTLLVPANTSAQLRMPDGSTQSVGSLSIRATEVTVGADGPAAMPGTLPGSSGFTYAVELSADEALAAGAASVEFDKPLFNYVDNFLGFAAGTKVPAGWYDTTKSEWVASDDGIVLTVVGETAGRADLDVTGDGVADTGAALTSLGITDTERTRLAELYDPAKSLWRVPITHFTPWDYNWPYSCQSLCEPPTAPNGPNRGPGVPEDGPTCTMDGSVIGCQGQTLGERVPIAGTPFTLVYESDRVLGRSDGRTITIPVTGPTPPAGLKRVDVKITVAGQTHRLRYDASPSRTVEWTWDGKDAYGRVMTDRVRADVDLVNVYAAVYRTPAEFPMSFAANPSQPAAATVTGNRSTAEIEVADTYQFTLGQRDARVRGFGGWTVDVHHQANDKLREVDQGDGTRRRLPIAQGTIDSIGAMASVSTYAHASLPDGSVVFYDFVANKIRKVDESGALLDFVGTGGNCPDDGNGCGDGGPAAAALLPATQVFSLAAAPDGTVYWMEQSRSPDPQAPLIRKRAPDGTVSRVVGNGSTCANPFITPSPPGCGEGLPALQVPLTNSTLLAVDPQGRLWFTHGVANKVFRRLDADGRVRTIYGVWNANGLPRNTGGPATARELTPNQAMAIGPDGSVYFLTGEAQGVLRIAPDGMVSVVGGNGTACVPNPATGECGLGQPAHEADLSDAEDIDVDEDGFVYVRALNRGSALQPVSGRMTIYRFRPGGPLERVAFGTVTGPDEAMPSPTEPCSGDGGPATAARGCAKFDMEVTDDGRIFVFPQPVLFGQAAQPMRIVKPGAGTLPAGQVGVPTTDGGRLDVFDRATGRHLSTIDTMTNAVLLTFGYDGFGRLKTITDGHGNVTTFERSGSGALTGVLAPFGQHTTLTSNASGYLASITTPGNRTTNLGYLNAEGLLTSFTAPGPAVHSFEYDAQGRLTKDTDPGGGFTSLSRSTVPDGYEVTTTTAGGRVETYRATQPDGGVTTHRHTDASGGITTSTTPADGAGTTTVTPDGQSATSLYGPDPRWGADAPVIRSRVVTAPSGRTSTASYAYSAVLADPDDLLSHSTLDSVESSNGQVSTTSFDAAARSLTTTSAVGIVNVTTFDAKGQVVGMAYEGLEPIALAYDARGRQTSVTQGARSRAYTYDANGRLATETRPTGAVTSYTYNAADELLTMTRPGSQVWQFAYDGRGNRQTITMPSGAQHQFGSTVRDEPSSYTAPGLPARSWDYTPDGGQVATHWSTGRVVSVGLDAGSRTTGSTQPGGTVGITWSGNTTRMATIDATTSPGGSAAATFGYDGGDLTSATWTGDVVGSFAYTYDVNGWASGVSFASGADTQTVGYSHDGDGGITAMGPFAVVRDGPNGGVSGLSDGTSEWTIGYNSFGETDDRRLDVAADVAYRQVVTSRDLSGRITGYTEETPAGIDSFALTYDAGGRLQTAKKNAQPTVTYTYNANGDRTGAGGVAATFDSADRVTAVGPVAYTHDADGYLTGRGSDTFIYGAEGELRSATVGGQTVSYTSDGWGRRVARTTAGGTEQFFYGNPAHPSQVTASRSPAGVLTYYFYDELGRMIALRRGGAMFYVGSDQVGTPKVVVDAAGNVVLQRTYDPFGTKLSDSAPAFGLPVGFAGGIEDPTTGLVRMGMRDYIPEAGQFAAVDPILFEGGLNPIAYVDGDPVNAHDPSGLRSVCLGAQAFLGFGGGFEYCAQEDPSTGRRTWSFCIEGGIGIGAGKVSGLKEPADAWYGSATEASAGCWGANFGSGQEKGRRNDACGRAQRFSKVVSFRGPWKGETVNRGTTVWKKEPELSGKCGATLKATAKGCWNWSRSRPRGGWYRGGS